MSLFKTRQQFAAELGISCRTLSRLILAHGLDIPARKLLSPADQRQIFLAIGLFSDAPPASSFDNGTAA